MTTDQPMERDTPPARKDGGARGKLTIAIVIVLVIALVIAALLAVDAWRTSEDELVPVTTTPQSTAVGSVAPSTTSPSTTSAATTAPGGGAASTAPPATDPAPTAPTPEDPLAGAVFPLPDSGARYTDPVEAARAFAVEFVGFADPILGEFLTGDSRSGEVIVRRNENGPGTTVFLRKLTDDDSWWVLGSASENIVVEEPDVRATVASPLTITGQSRVFEGTVNVELRADGAADPLVEDFVTGGSGPDFGPFEGTFEFESPGSGGGALMALSYSAEDGTVDEASVTRVFFAVP